MGVVVSINFQPNPLPFAKQEQRGNTIGNIANFGFVAQQGDWIYFTRQPEFIIEPNPEVLSGLYKVRTDGSDLTRLDDAATFINVVGDWVYYRKIDTEQTKGVIKGRLYKVRTDDSER